MSEIKILEDLKVHGDLKPTGAIHDSGDSPGTIGQILQSTATGTDWVDGVDISAGDAEAVHLAVKNTSGATITKGTPVYITGNVGGSDRLEIAPADASDVAKMPAVGLLESDLINNAEGYVAQGGFLKQIATDTIDGTSTTSNDTVYVKAGGGLTMTKPTGTNYIQNVAKVARVHASNGSLVVSSILRTNDVPTPLYIDHTNQRLGIGTTSPDTKLDVQGSIKASSGVVANGNDVTGYTGHGLEIRVSGGVGGVLSYNRTDSAYKPLSIISSRTVFQIGTSEKMRIDSNGNVGIGTTSPGERLNIYNTSSTGVSIRFGNSEDSSGYITYKNDDLQLITDYAVRVHIKDDGNVGIGTTSPTAKFHVYKSSHPNTMLARFENPTGEALVEIKSQNDTLSILQFADSEDGNVGAVQYSHVDNSMRFKSNDTERMRIDSSGNVGIGTTSPDVKLEVVEASPTDGIIADFVNSTNAGGTTAAIKLSNADSEACDVVLGANRVGANFGSDFFISLSDGVDGSNQERFRITEAGNVGIGTTAPLNPLSIESSSSPLIKIRNTTNGGGAAIEFNDNATSAATQNGRIKYVHSDTASQGGGSSFILEGENDQTLQVLNNGRVVVQRTGSSTEVGYGFYNDVNTGMYSPGADTVALATAGNNRLHINSSGNVGIGTTSPDAQLHIGSQEATPGGTAGTVDRLIIQPYSNTGGPYKFKARTVSGSEDYLDLYYGSNQIVSYGLNGNVGIGTTSPGFKLEVSGDIRSTGYMLATGGVRVPYAVSTKKPMIVLNGATNYGLFHTEGSSDIFSFDYGGVPKQTFNQNGNASFSGDLTVSGGDITLGGTGRIQGIDTVSSSTDAANKSYVDNNTAPAVSFTRNINSSTYSMLATVNGDRLSSIVKMTITGTSGNVVIASTFEITANHSQDIHVKSSNGDYTEVTIRISSNGDEDYSIEAKHNGSTTTEVEVFIYPLAGEVVTPTTTNPNYTTSVYEHTATEGWRFGGEDGNAESSNVIVDGKLGIGTTSPGVNFQVGDGTTDATSRFYYNDNTYTEINGYGLYMSRNSSYIRPTADNSKTLYVGTSDRQWGALSFDATNTYFNTNGSQRMRIDSSGRVGIGTDSPSKKLHVDSGTISDIARFENDNGVFTLGQTSFLTSLDLASSNAYRIRQGSDVPFYINASGNVGIGTTSPGYKLHVSGNSFIDATSASAALTLGRYSGQPTIKASTDDGGYLLMDSTNNSLGLNWYSNRNVVLVNGGGNVGIGTISPGAKLDVNGDYILNNQRGLMVRSIDESNYFSFNDESTTADFEQQLPKTSGGGSVAKVDDPTAPAPGCFEITGDYNSDIASVNRYIKIDVASEYTWEIYVKFVSGTDTSQSIYLGSGMWDADKNYFGNTQRYWGASNVFVDANSLNDDWHHIKGTIKGVGSNTGNFISGTEYIAPIALLNYGNNANVIRVCGLKLYKSEKSATSLKLNRYGAKNYYDVDTAYPEGRLKIENSGSDTLRARNDHGYIDIGPANSTYAHITTDRGEFYFNKRISVDEGIISSYNEDLKLRTGTTTAVTILNANQNVGIGTTSPLQKFHTAGVAYFSGGTNVAFQSGGDVHSNSAIVIDKGDKIKVRAGQYLRDLLHQDSTNNIIKIGQTGTALITGINLEAGHDGSANSAQVRVYGGSTEYVRFDGFNKIVGIGTTAPASGAKLTVMGNQTFGLPGSGSNTSGRFLSIEGNADSAGEGSGRIFFTEHNSSTAAMDKYGLSIGYRGGATSVVGASGNTWTGLSQIGNGEWGFFGHNNDATGRVIMKGARAGTNIDFNTNSLGNATYYKVTAGNGYGINFWNSTSYSIYMSIASSSTRLDTNSDYNMYFKMSGGTNRGFVFMNSGTPVAQIDSTGKVYAEGGLDVSGHVYAGQGVQTITSTSGTINLNARDYGIFKLSNDLTGATTFNLQYMKSGQVIDIIVSGSQVITFTSDDTSETFNKVGGVDYDGASDNHIQIVCIDSTNSAAIYNYTVGTYESDTTP